MINYLQILEYSLNLNLISQIEVKDGKDPGVVRISYRDHGNTYSIDLVRKENMIAEPLTKEEIREAIENSIRALSKGAGFVKLTDYLGDKDNEKNQTGSNS